LDQALLAVSLVEAEVQIEGVEASEQNGSGWLRRRWLRRPTRNQLTQILHMGRLQGAVLVIALTLPVAAIWAYARGQSDGYTWLAFPASVCLVMVFNFMVLRLPDEPAYKWMRARSGDQPPA
jgi:hypothetical protein